MNIYRLQVVCDNPIFDGFAHDADLEYWEKITPGFHAVHERYWEQPSFKSWWKPPKVEGRVASYVDFPGLNLIHPVFSRRAVDALRDLLEPNGELLPLDSDAGEYYFYNCQTLSDSLVLEKSKFPWIHPGTRILKPDYYYFDEEKVQGLSFFMLYVHALLFATETVKQRVEDAGLLGFNFIKVWPYPEGTIVWQEEKKKRVLSVGYLKQHTVVVMLPLLDKSPSPDEQVHISQLEDNLNRLLAVPSPDAIYFGCYEGHDTKKKTYRMFLSCPDADKLVEKLRLWLTSLQWPVKAKYVRRYGSMYDTEAIEKSKTIPSSKKLP